MHQSSRGKGGVTVILLALVGVNSASAKEAEGCREIRARIVSSISTTDCSSPVGLCTKGTLMGDPLLRGSFDYITQGMTSVPLNASGGTALSYFGNLTITTPRGRLFVSDLGVLHEGGASFSELSTEINGTGKFQDVSGHLFFYGAVSATGFMGDLRGTLCHRRTGLL